MAILADLSLRLSANVAELKTALDSASKKVGSFKDQVGQVGSNMSKSFKSASKEVSNSLNFMTGGMSGLAQTAITTFKTMTAGIRGFTAAFISTGIGAIIVAVSVAIMGLVAAFKRSGEAGDKMDKIMGFLKGTLDYFIKQLVKVGEWLIKAFEDPKTAIKELWEVIKQNLVTRFQGVVQIFTAGWDIIKNGAMGVGLAIKGIFDKDAREESKKYFKEMKDGFIKMGEAAIMITTGKTLEDLKEIGKEIMKNGQISAALVEREDKLAERKRDWLVQEQRLETELSRTKERLADQEFKSDEGKRKRQELLESVIKQQNAISAKRVALAYEEWQLLVAQNNARGDTSDEAITKEREAQKNYEAEVTKSVDETLRFKKQETAVQTQINAEVAKQAEEERKNAEETAARIRKLSQETAILEIADAQTAEEAKLGFDRDDLLRASKSAEEQAAIWENYYAKLDVLSKEYQKEKQEESADKAKNIIQEGINDEKLGYSEKLKLLQDYSKQAQLTEKELADYKLALDEAEKERKMSNLQMGLDFAQQALGALAGFQEAAMNKELESAGDNEAKKDEIRRKYAKKQKSMAIIMAVINGAQAIIKGFADLGPIGGAISAVLIAATTAAQIATIKSQPLAEGGLAYGKTLATIGEYPGAKNNPEVVAPLDKLKSLLGGSQQMFGEVKFVIEQNQLVGILQKASNKQIYF